jgi:hypothetical protein
MSKQAWEVFRARLAEDQALRAEMTRILSHDGKRTTASVEELAEFAKSRDYDVSPDEIREALELSDDQLDSVSGGTAGSFTTSPRTFHMETITIVCERIERVSG